MAAAARDEIKCQGDGCLVMELIYYTRIFFCQPELLQNESSPFSLFARRNFLNDVIKRGNKRRGMKFASRRFHLNAYGNAGMCRVTFPDMCRRWPRKTTRVGNGPKSPRTLRLRGIAAVNTLEIQVQFARA